MVVRRRAAWLFAGLLVATSVSADTRSDFEAAVGKWRAAKVSSYSFAWRDSGGVPFAPPCVGAIIRVRVVAGESVSPVVEHGTRRCPRGLRGERAIELNVPTSIEIAFEQMKRLIDAGPDVVRISAVYDPEYGIPLKFSAEKLQWEDDDEGFEIVGFYPGRR